MSIVAKWFSGLLALGAGYLVLTNPNGFATATSSIRGLTAGSVSDITTGGTK